MLLTCTNHFALALCLLMGVASARLSNTADSSSLANIPELKKGKLCVQYLLSRTDVELFELGHSSDDSKRIGQHCYVQDRAGKSGACTYYAKGLPRLNTAGKYADGVVPSPDDGGSGCVKGGRNSVCYMNSLDILSAEEKQSMCTNDYKQNAGAQLRWAISNGYCMDRGVPFDCGSIDFIPNLDLSPTMEQYNIPCIPGGILVYNSRKQPWLSHQEVAAELPIPMHLLEPQTKEINDCLKASLTDPRSPLHKYKNVPAWLGGNDINSEGEFKWSSNKAPFSFTEWNPREPNNAGVDGEDCLEQSLGKWNDNRCDKAFPGFYQLSIRPTCAQITPTLPSTMQCYDLPCIPGKILVWNSEKMSWWSHKTRAADLPVPVPMQLLEPRNVEINDCLVNHLWNSKIKTERLGESWLGGTDEYSEGTFVWDSDREPLTFTHWDWGEPNDDFDENCVHYQGGEFYYPEYDYYYHDTGWYDQRCGRALYAFYQLNLDLAA